MGSLSRNFSQVRACVRVHMCVAVFTALGVCMGSMHGAHGQLAPDLEPSPPQRRRDERLGERRSGARAREALPVPGVCVCLVCVCAWCVCLVCLCLVCLCAWSVCLVCVSGVCAWCVCACSKGARGTSGSARAFVEGQHAAGRAGRRHLRGGGAGAASISECVCFACVCLVCVYGVCAWCVCTVCVPGVCAVCVPGACAVCVPGACGCIHSKGVDDAKTGRVRWTWQRTRATGRLQGPPLRIETAWPVCAWCVCAVCVPGACGPPLHMITGHLRRAARRHAPCTARK
jgi:hypothetical protein